MNIIRPFTVTVGALTSNIPEADYTAYSASPVYILGDRVMYNHKNYESLDGKAVTLTGTATLAQGRIFCVAHALAPNTRIVFTGATAAGTGLVDGTVYYVGSVAAGTSTDYFTVTSFPNDVGGGMSTSASGTSFTARASNNYNKTPDTNPTVWLDIGATNRWKMFDTSVQSQTVGSTGLIQADIAVTDIIDSVALINISGATTAQCTFVTVDGTVYDSTAVVRSTEGVYDAYTYFFEPIVYVTELTFTNIPPYATGTLTVKLTNAAGAPVYCGGCVLGKSLYIGATEVGAKVGIQDYSVKSQDAFGNYTITQRAYSKRASFTITMESKLVDQVENLLASFRSTPIVYIGTTAYGATLVYGFYKNFDIDIGYSDGTSVCSLEVEGLT